MWSSSSTGSIESPTNVFLVLACKHILHYEQLEAMASTADHHIILRDIFTLTDLV